MTRDLVRRLRFAAFLAAGLAGGSACGGDPGTGGADDGAAETDGVAPDVPDLPDTLPDRPDDGADDRPGDDAGDGEAAPDEGPDAGDEGGAPVCGNGVREAGEGCDDGNATPGDGCEPDCRFSCLDAAGCDDGDPCSRDTCEAVAAGQACRHTADPGASCDDGDPCTADDRCDADGACAGTPAPPAAPVPVAPVDGAYLGGVVLPEALTPRRPVLRWRSGAVGCAGTSHQVEVDDTCEAATFVGCDFPSPEASGTTTAVGAWTPATDLPVSILAPVGRRYYWRVRACRGAICSDWSRVRRMEVGRAPADYDGDGYSDLAVGAFGGASQEGLVFVYRGAAAGLGTSPDRTLSLVGNPVGSGFGMALAWAGDLNGDGFGDLAVGAPFVDGSGVVHLYLGSAAGIAAAADAVLRMPGGSAGALFGRSLAAAGDVNGDGWDDLAVGASSFAGASSSEGAVYLFHGGSPGPATTAAAVLRGSPVERGARFGTAVAGGGDVDGDGYADLLAGAPFADGAGPDTGAAWLFRGGPSGISPLPAAVFVDPAPEFGSQFGFAALLGGDLDDDGLADLAVGAPLHDGAEVNELRAYVWYGTADAFPAAPAAVLAAPRPTREAHFGGSLGSAGDINRAGGTELLVGAELLEAGSAAEGNAFVYYGVAGGIAATPTGVFDNPAGEVNGMFGVCAVSAGDMNGDGYGDVAIGAWVQDGDTADEGAAFVYHGCSCGVISTLPSRTLDHPLDRFDARFGFAIAAGAGR